MKLNCCWKALNGNKISLTITRLWYWIQIFLISLLDVFLMYWFWHIFFLFLEHGTNSIPDDCKEHETLVVYKRLFFTQFLYRHIYIYIILYIYIIYIIYIIYNNIKWWYNNIKHSGFQSKIIKKWIIQILPLKLRANQIKYQMNTLSL